MMNLLENTAFDLACCVYCLPNLDGTTKALLLELAANKEVLGVSHKERMWHNWKQIMQIKINQPKNGNCQTSSQKKQGNGENSTSHLLWVAHQCLKIDTQGRPANTLGVGAMLVYMLIQPQDCSFQLLPLPANCQLQPCQVEVLLHVSSDFSWPIDDSDLVVHVMSQLAANKSCKKWCRKGCVCVCACFCVWVSLIAVQISTCYHSSSCKHDPTCTYTKD